MTATVHGQVGRTTLVVPSTLKTYVRNPRKGNVGVIAASLKAHGQYRPIVVNIGTHTGRPMEVLAGNHTLRAFRDLAEKNPDDERWNEILVHWVDYDEDQAKRVVLADNRTSELGSYDNTELLGLIDDVKGDLAGIGYTNDDVDKLRMFAHPVDPNDEALTDEDADLADDEDGEDYDDDPDESGRGAPIIAYSIVFDNAKQKTAWMDFINWLRRSYPDLTAAERMVAYIDTQLEVDEDDDDR